MAGVIGYGDNYCALDLDGVPSLSIGGGTATFDPLKPGANLLDPNPSKVTRVNIVATGAGSLDIYPVWDSAANSKTVRVIAALNVRLPSSITDVAARTLTFGLATQNNAERAYTAAERVPIPGTTDRYDLFFYLTADSSAAAAALNVAWAGAFTDYIEIGCLVAMKALVFPSGVGREWNVQPIDESPVERSAGGAVSAFTLPTRQSVTFPLNNETYAQALGTANSPAVPSLRQVLRENGTSKPVIVLPRTSDEHALQVLGTYGHFTSIPSIDHAGGNYFDAGSATVEQRR